MKVENDTFCAAPFSQMVLKPNGHVAPCCFLYQLKLGDVKRESLEEVWNGEKIKNFRQKFLDGVPKICRSKIRDLKCNANYSHLLPFVDKQPVQNKSPMRLDLRLNGTCNLSCVMCEVWQEPRGVYDQSQFWEHGEKYIFPYLRELEVLGGEPFIQKDTFRLLDVVTKLNSECKWSFVSNGHYKFSNYIRSRLEKIPLKQIQFSLDSLDADTYRSIRRKGDLSLVLETLEKFQHFRTNYSKHRQDFSLIYSMCVLRNNWKEIPGFIKFCHTANATPQFQFAYYDPSQESSLQYATNAELRDLLASLEGELPRRDLAYLDPIINPVLGILQRRQIPNE